MTDVSNDRRGTLSPRWYWLQALLIAGSALTAALLWRDIPTTVTTHYNFRFEPDGFGAKSWGTVFLLNIVQLCLLLTMLGTNAVIARTTSVQASDKGENEAKRREFRFVNSVFLYGLSLLLTAFFSYIQATMLYGWPSRVLAVVTVLVMLLVIGGIVGLTVTVRRLGLQEQGGGDGEGAAGGAHWLAGGGL